MTILIIGSSSFAAGGIAGKLRQQGHTVWTYDRRAPDASANTVTGPLKEMIPRLTAAVGQCDVVINYVLLKGADVAANLAFCEELVRLCEKLGVRRLIHISSIITTSLGPDVVTEDTPAEASHTQKSPYSKLKIATENWLAQNCTCPELVMVRPGFIVGPGLADPIPGMAKALPSQHLLGLGARDTTVPFISKAILDEGMVRLCTATMPGRRAVAMFVDRNSPTREEYLQACCDELGMGQRPLHLPRWFWYLAMGGATLGVSLLRRRWDNMVLRFRHNLKPRTYDPTRTEQWLGLSFNTYWRDVLRATFSSQEKNYRLPLRASVTAVETGVARLPDRILFVGVGRIVHDRHFPALARMGFQGVVEWYDPYQSAPPSAAGLKLQRVVALADSTAEHAIVATPAYTRRELLQSLPRQVRRLLCEKPAALTRADFAALEEGSGGREVFVMHNYRYKDNAIRFLQSLARRNAGELRTVRLQFDSPPIDFDSAAWMRDDARARALLMDYGLHFVDLAWWFSREPMASQHCAVRRNARGQVESIEVFAAFANHTTHLFLRHGARQRQCRIEFVFQNCTHVLSFFPDTFDTLMAQHTFADDTRAAWQGGWATAGKVAEKLGLTAGDASHERVLRGFLDARSGGGIEELSLPALAPFYRNVLTVADGIYGPQP